MINILLENQDNMELVRDKLKEILDAELANQRVLATNAGKSPVSWDIRVFIERTAPWEEFMSPDDDQYDDRPIINISFEDSNTEGASTTPTLQQFTGVFNLDVMTAATAKSTAQGHDPGDYSAGVRAQEVIRIIRNILFAVEYDTLQLTGSVTDRRIVGITRQEFQDPNYQITPYAIRLRLGVGYNEKVPEYVGVSMEQLNVNTTIRDEQTNSQFNYNN